MHNYIVPLKVPMHHYDNEADKFSSKYTPQPGPKQKACAFSNWSFSAFPPSLNAFKISAEIKSDCFFLVAFGLVFLSPIIFFQCKYACNLFTDIQNKFGSLYIPVKEQ